MPRRVPIRLVRLLAVACACLVPAAAAQAAAARRTTSRRGAGHPVALAVDIALGAPVVVQASDWGEATTGPEDANPLPSCTGSTGFRSMWYSLPVPEAAVLRVTRRLDRPGALPARRQHARPGRMSEVGCGLANDVKPGATANATAYVTPAADGTPQTYLVRVAEVAQQLPVGRPAHADRALRRRDVTPPHIRVCSPEATAAAGCPDDLRRPSRTTDKASQVNPATALWEFHDGSTARNDVMKPRTALRVNYTWKSPGPHDGRLPVADIAGNQNMYRFTTLVRDTVGRR